MGDMADFALDTIEWSRHSGPKLPTCKYCGRTDLNWTKTENGWRLWDVAEKKIHTCPAYRKVEESPTAPPKVVEWAHPPAGLRPRGKR